MEEREKIARLQEMVDRVTVSSFLAGQGSARRAASRIFAALTDCITSSMPIRRKLF